ncbi:hypothetical protein GIB67_040379 [Kingdonia uniflora]|uniref:Uncharacterized protein n=1 Tax=Kingdonia uniflora TaxID=39325 RepID=A0A7J7KXK6_9MAGN|nr:hypothetical protein GIB67_040379 [Kingdonia uniflora]
MQVLPHRTNLIESIFYFAEEICQYNTKCCECLLCSFSPYSANLLAFGSANCKTYCYDLRNTKNPRCTLSGHGKVVSYIKF